MGTIKSGRCRAVADSIIAMSSIDQRLLLLWVDDNVLVARSNIAKGATVTIDGRSVVLLQALALGHKIARRALSTGSTVYKYGAPIGRVTQGIEVGEHVHIHNVASNYTRSHAADETPATEAK